MLSEQSWQIWQIWQIWQLQVQVDPFALYLGNLVRVAMASMRLRLAVYLPAVPFALKAAAHALLRLGQSSFLGFCFLIWKRAVPRSTDLLRRAAPRRALVR